MRTPHSFIVCGLGYGDEGKGSWVDYLVRQHGIRYVIRFNGGYQAAHNVWMPDGIHHCFCHYGSGMLVPGTTTVLSRHMLVEPWGLLEEAKALESMGVSALSNLLIDRNCPVVTSINILLNRITETSLGGLRHGSCGKGIGLTQHDVEHLEDAALYVRDLSNRDVCRDKLSALWHLKMNHAEQRARGIEECAPFIQALRELDLNQLVDEYEAFAGKVNIVDSPRISGIIGENDCVFEGAQGALLDRRFGFFPNVTNSYTTFTNALGLLDEAGFSGEVEKVGLLRGYATRHGRGPFVSEDSDLLSQIPMCDNETDTGAGPWQGNFRLGWFDAVAARYALEAVGGVDTLILTNLDRMTQLEEHRVAESYRMPTINPRFFDYGNGKTANGIKVLGNLGTDESAERTSLLIRAKPIYTCQPGKWGRDICSLAWYVRWIGETLGRKVDGISCSNTAAAKEVFPRSI